MRRSLHIKLVLIMVLAFAVGWALCLEVVSEGTEPDERSYAVF